MAADFINLFPNKGQFDRMNELLAIIASKCGNARPESWADIQQAVRLGVGPTLFPIGTQLMCERATKITASVAGSTGITAATVDLAPFVGKMGTARGGIYEFVHNGHSWHFGGKPVSLADYGISVTGTAVEGDVIHATEATDNIVWDIVAHDYNVDPHNRYDHSMTLLTHDCVVNSLQFDSPEALYYCETQLDAGTYHIKLLDGYDTANGGGRILQFTLTKPVPANGVIMFPWVWSTQSTSTKISTYSTVTDTVAIESVAVTEGGGGTDLGTADGQTPNMNHTHRIRYGSNNWKESAIRQFLNSAAPAGGVWKPQTKFDRPPSWAASQSGWMNGLDPEFLAVVGTTKVTNRTNSLYEEGGNVSQNYYTEDKFWLPSRSELFGGSESDLSDGTLFPYYSGAANADRIKYNTSGAARCWWLRSPGPSSANYIRVIFTAGSLYFYTALNAYGVAVACTIFG